ncbi:MAG: hypothetical protein LQ346_003207 [Caloplaca aetnensis]|nr:MAG: hypothetical protein LQ346_003207 [Caloplaca aetnensis]
MASASVSYGTILPSADNKPSKAQNYSRNQDEPTACSRWTQAESEESLDGLDTARFWLAIGCVLCNDFVASFDSTLMASIHPVITSYFSASGAAPWLSTTFLVTSTAFMPLFAPLSDIIGRRTVWAAASTVFTLALLWCAMAPSIGSFIAARTFCGLGAGGVYSMGLIILNDLVPTDRRAMFQSCLVLAFGLGQASGAAFGGLLCDTIGWRGAFWIQIPAFVVCGGTSYLAVPKSLGPQLGKRSNGAWKALVKTFDVAGMSVLALSVTCLILYLNLGGVVLPWSHPALIASLIASVISGGLFVVIESRVQYPVMPLRLLLGAPRANINYVNFLGSIIMAAILFNAPLFFEAVKHDSPTVAGLRLIAPFLALTVSGFLSCMTMCSVGRIRPGMLFGAVMMLAGTVCIGFMSQEVSSWVSLVLLLPSSLGQGFLFPASVLFLLRASLPAEHAVVTSTLLLWRRLGSVVGVAVSTLVVRDRLSFYLGIYISGPDQAKSFSSLSFYRPKFRKNQRNPRARKKML